MAPFDSAQGRPRRSSGQARLIASFDSVVLAAIAREIENVVGGRIVHVAQPAAEEIQLSIRRGHAMTNLLCSIHPRWARVHLTAHRSGSEPQPTPFCQMLRRRLDRARLITVTQPAFDRALTLGFETVEGRLALVIEIMGRRSNLILVQEGIITGSLKPVPRSKSSVREVLPGRPYTAPPRDRPTPLELTPEALSERLAGSADPLPSGLAAAVLGVSPVMARELAVRSGLDPDRSAAEQADAGKRLWPHLQELVAVVGGGRFEPILYLAGTEPVGFAPFRFVHAEHLQAMPVAHMSDAVDAVAARWSTQSRLDEQRAALLAVVTAALERMARAKAELQHAAAEADQGGVMKEYGELLLAYASQVPTGASEVTVPGYDGSPVTISLDPTLSPIENAQRIFKRYGKLRAARPTIARRLRQIEIETAYLESVGTMIEHASSPDDLVDLRRELVEEGHLRARGMPARPSSAPGPRAFRLSTGETVLVGRTNRENDHLTFRVAAPDDLWLHARGVPGAHVILKLNGREPTGDAVRQAAAIAAHFSRARGSARVAVDITQRRHVRKPRGSKPGMVVYERERTLHVTPGLPGDS